MWVRGLKHPIPYTDIFPVESHPMWVRGLKRDSHPPLRRPVQGRTLCGCVD